MRHIVSGGRPEDYGLAGGAEVRFGPDKGKLQAAFQASGKGTYAVIVSNNSGVPATYTISANGATSWPPAPTANWCKCCPSSTQRHREA